MKLRSIPKTEKTTPKQNKVLAKLRKKVIIQAVVAVQALVIVVGLVFGMSAAWYNNVLQTSGLQFQAEAWGFSGQVTVAGTPITAAPGDGGIVDIVIDNSRGQMLDATVQVNKDSMQEAMQQRMFFYVEDSVTRNGEVMDRVYVNAVSGYTYTVLESSILTLTQARANDAALQWQWVYDMLGYYFLGTVNQEGTHVDEYLRPVEYDLDSATFDFNGKLQTVDGTTMVSTFLNQLAASYCYAGDTITASSYEDYYQVSVDANGYGVWVYLCDWENIAQATAYDTQLGMDAAQGNALSIPAVVTLTGQQSNITYTQVADAEQLVTVLENGGSVQLSQDLVLTEPLQITATTQSVLDLNDYTITGPTDNVALSVTEGSQLLVLGGTITGGNASSDVVKVTNSDLTLSNVTINGAGDDAVDVVDRGGAGDSCVKLFNCQINVNGCAVYMCGNGSESEGITKVIVEDCVLNSGYITVMSNGNSTNWGTELQISRSTLSGYYAALYQPQGDSITMVTESSLSGITGAVIKSGTLLVENSTLHGTGAAKEPVYEGSGFTDTGDALYIEDSYQRPITVRVSGSNTKLLSDNAQAVRVFMEDSTCVDLVITGGIYSSDVSAYLPEGYELVAGVVTKKEG